MPLCAEETCNVTIIVFVQAARLDATLLHSTEIAKYCTDTCCNRAGNCLATGSLYMWQLPLHSSRRWAARLCNSITALQLAARCSTVLAPAGLPTGTAGTGFGLVCSMCEIARVIVKLYNNSRPTQVVVGSVNHMQGKHVVVAAAERVIGH
jgi:hypothetical protein